MPSSGYSKRADASPSVPQKLSWMRRSQPLGVTSDGLIFGVRETVSLIAVFVEIDPADSCGARHLRIRVADARKVSCTGLKIQVFEQVIVLRKFSKLGNPALRIFQVSEDDRLGRTTLFTSGLHRIRRQRQIAYYTRL